MNSANITISGDAQAYLGKLKSPGIVLACLSKALDQENQLTITHVVLRYLSFPRTFPTQPTGLRVITGRLRGAARATQPRLLDGLVSSSLGSFVKYAEAQEFGADIPSRPTRSKRPNWAKKHPTTKAFSITGRHMFWRGLQDRLPDYSQALSASILNLKEN